MSTNHTCPVCGGLAGHRARAVANTLAMGGMHVRLCQGHPEPPKRDTQFAAGFAKSLNRAINDLAMSYTPETFPGTAILQEQIEQLLARAAYDLVEHTLKNAPITEYECDPWDIPDLVVNGGAYEPSNC